MKGAVASSEALHQQLYQNSLKSSWWTQLKDSANLKLLKNNMCFRLVRWLRGYSSFCKSLTILFKTRNPHQGGKREATHKHVL